MQQLEIESLLLSWAFTRFLLLIMLFFSQMEIPAISMLEWQLSVLKTYHTKCYLQQHNLNDLLICLDTGCLMSSTFSLDDFEVQPMEGPFGQLKTITAVVPILHVGIICWHVHDSAGNEAIIWVPGYYIPSSSQCLLSPQNYAMFHGWGKY